MEVQIFQTNPRLRSLLLILIFTFAASGIALAVLAQIGSYHSKQIYLATEAALPRPRHIEASLFGNIPSTTLGTVGDIANWKTYRNEEYGFEFRYPQNWVLKDFIKNQVDADSYYDLLVSYVTLQQNSLRGITYCGAYTGISNKRCEVYNNFRVLPRRFQPS